MSFEKLCNPYQKQQEKYVFQICFKMKITELYKQQNFYNFY